MDVVYNNEIIKEEELKINSDDRAFKYGDGFFETIIMQKEEVLFLDYHFKRLTEAFQAFAFTQPAWFTKERLSNQIVTLAKLYNFSDARFRLQIWRKTGGFYTPTQNEVNILLSIMPYYSPPILLAKASFSNEVTIFPSKTSSFKTLNALPYILAGLEKQQKGLDEIILLNNEGFITECSASNIFWKKNQIWYTPDISTGCIAGVRRAFILENFKAKGITIKEVLAQQTELLQADAVCCCNVGGVFSIQDIDETIYKCKVINELMF